MKNRIRTAIALVSLLISCRFGIGYSPSLGYTTVDLRSELMQPTFNVYQDRYFQQRSNTRSLSVFKSLRASGEKKRLEFDRLSLVWEDSQTVWQLEYKSSVVSTCLYHLLGWRSTTPVFSLTYGEVPPGYEEKVKAVPLEPEEFYTVRISGNRALYFIIRLNDTGISERLEYMVRDPLFTHWKYYQRPY